MKTWQIWSEGYMATGGSSGAVYMGKSQGDSFKEACDNFFTSEDQKRSYCSESMTYWGCRLFENESSARKSFG